MALSADKAPPRQSRGRANRLRAAIATSQTVYIGSLLNFVTTTSRVRAAAAATSRKIAGVCTEFESDSGTATGIGNTSGTQYAWFEYGNEHLFTIKTAIRTHAAVGLNVFVSDDDTVGGTAVGTSAVRVVVGELVERSGTTQAWVAVHRFAAANIAI